MNYKISAHAFQCFTHEQVKEINKQIKKNVIEKEKSYSAASTTSKIGKFVHVPCSPLMELIHPWLYQCQKINREVFGYDIYWDFYLDTLNYNVYGTGGEYGWHVDGTTEENTPIDSKLTCLLDLSEEPYEGGKFKLVTINDEIEFVSGMGLVFNSLIAHKVTPIIKGERTTLSYWAVGQAWR